jgi:chromosome segregation ATPase
MTDQWTEPIEDTITLLMEEVARLESELRYRDEAELARCLNSSPVDKAEPADAGLLRQIEELTADIQGRDETITVLLEQTQLFEESAAAQRAEWEQLHQWVEEVERRVEGKDAREANLEAEIAAERRRGETLRNALESERRAAESRIRALEQAAGSRHTPIERSGEGAANAELQRENQWLREECAQLERAVGAAVGPIRDSLETARCELEESKRELRRVVDEQERERNEAAAALTELRSRLARESLEKKPSSGAAERPRALIEADERIRAFREHLRDLHNREAEERAGRTLSSRLSRLWRTTGPS